MGADPSHAPGAMQRGTSGVDAVGCDQHCPAPVGTCASLRHGGAVAQLGERLVRNEEVSGSIPLSSTIPPCHPCYRDAHCHRCTSAGASTAVVRPFSARPSPAKVPATSLTWNARAVPIPWLATPAAKPRAA